MPVLTISLDLQSSVSKWRIGNLQRFEIFEFQTEPYSLKLNLWRRIKDFPYFLCAARTYDVFASGTINQANQLQSMNHLYEMHPKNLPYVGMKYTALVLNNGTETSMKSLTQLTVIINTKHNQFIPNKPQILFERYYIQQ